MVVLYIYLLISTILLFGNFKFTRKYQKQDKELKKILTRDEMVKMSLFLTIIVSLLWPVYFLINPRIIKKNFMYGVGYIHGFVVRRKGG